MWHTGCKRYLPRNWFSLTLNDDIFLRWLTPFVLYFLILLTPSWAVRRPFLFFCIIFRTLSHESSQGSKPLCYPGPSCYGACGSLHVGLVVNISALLYMVCCRCKTRTVLFPFAVNSNNHRWYFQCDCTVKPLLIYSIYLGLPTLCMWYWHTSSLCRLFSCFIA